MCACVLLQIPRLIFTSCSSCVRALDFSGIAAGPRPTTLRLDGIAAAVRITILLQELKIFGELIEIAIIIIIWEAHVVRVRRYSGDLGFWGLLKEFYVFHMMCDLLW